MNLWTRALTWLGIREAVMPAGVAPVPYWTSTGAEWGQRRAIAMPAVFRALSVLTTSASQLTIDVWRGARPMSVAPSIIRKPSLNQRRSEWISQVILDLATDGNCYLLKSIGAGPSDVLDLRILPAAEVMVTRDPLTGQLEYHHKREKYTSADIIEVNLLKPAGWLRGIGPLEAARRGLQFADGAAAYASNWWNAGQPTGILTSDQALTGQQAREYRDVWNAAANDTSNPSGIKVLGKGLTYSPIFLKPADVLWLEAQDANTVDVARIFGIPVSLMAIGIDGASTTYANVQQEWLAFVRFTLMGFLRPLEEALTDVLGTGYEARFNLEGLLRGDTASRYEAHRLAIEAGWMDADEVREIEGLPARAAAEIKENQP